MKKKRILATSVSLAAIASVLLVGCGGKGRKTEVPESTPETKASFEKAIKNQAIAQSTETENKVTDYYTNGIKVEVEKAEDIATVYVPTEKYVRDKEGYTKVSDIKSDEKIVVEKGVIKGVVKVSEVKPATTKPVEKKAEEPKVEAKPVETTKASEVKKEEVKPIKKYEEKEIKYKETKHTKKEYEEISKRDVSKAKTDTDESIKKALEAESHKSEIPKIVEKKAEEPKVEAKPVETTKTGDVAPERPKEENKSEAVNTQNNTPAPAPAPQPQPENPAPQPEPEPQPQPEPAPQPQPAPTEQKRDWQPVYRTVHHDAITHTRPKFICSDGSKTTYNRKEMEDYIWDRMDADENANLSYTTVNETVVDKEAWDEQVLDHYVDTYTGETKPL